MLAASFHGVLPNQPVCAPTLCADCACAGELMLMLVEDKAAGATHKQLAGLTCSMIKLATAAGHNDYSLSICYSAATTASQAMQLAVRRTTVAAAGASIGVSELALSSMQWLVLYGRCCLYSALILDPIDLTILQQRRRQQKRGCILTGLLVGMESAEHAAPLTAEGLTQGVTPWLQQFSSALMSLGYPLGTLTAQLGAVKTAWDVAQTSLAKDFDGAAAAAVTQLARTLRVFGLAASSLAVGQFCNNPGCRDVSGGSENGLVSGVSSCCSACKVARYCGKGCQRQHWQQHKPACKALAASRACGASGGSHE